MENVGDILKDKGGVSRYKGFTKPNYTATPDDIFDVFLTTLSHAELKVLLYIVRRTFGFKKYSDKISLKQICEGILRKDGRTLDSGAGIGKSTAKRVIKSLEKRGLITVQRVKTSDGYNYVNTYSLKFRGRG